MSSVNGVIILTYHSVADAGTAVSLPPRQFQDQISWLQDRYRIVSLEEALRLEVLDDDVVVLTFDDGYEDYLTAALPVLSKHSIPSTVYPITELVLNPERGFAFAAGRGKAPLTRAQVADLGQNPLVTVGSHSHTHARLIGLPARQMEVELDRSLHLLQELVGTTRIHFCYPWGVYDRAADALVRERFASAVTAREGKNVPPWDPFSLWRIPIKRGSLSRFAKRVEGRLVLERSLRRLKQRLGAGRSMGG